MTYIDYNLLNWNGSALGTRTISREIKFGSLIHERLVRGGGCKILEGEDNPPLYQIANGLYMKVGSMNSHHSKLIEIKFHFLKSSEENKREAVIHTLFVEICGIIPMLKKNSPYIDFSGVCIFSRGYFVETDNPSKPLSKQKLTKSKWQEVEIDYNPHRRYGTIYFMEETTDPLPLEQLSWDDVHEILKWRHGSNIICFYPQKGVYQEFRVLGYGEPLDRRYMKYSIQFSNSTFYIRCSHTRDIFGKEKRGKWVELIDKKDGGFMLSVLDKDINTLPPPYILANGEVHFQTPDGSHITSFPLSKAARSRLIKSATSQPKASAIGGSASGGDQPSV